MKRYLKQTTLMKMVKTILFCWLCTYVLIWIDRVSTLNYHPGTVFSTACPSESVIQEEHNRVRDALMGYRPCSCAEYDRY